jgi:isopenicillin N synthase-like dioxygenase
VDQIPTHAYRAFNLGEFQDGKAQQPLPPSLAPHEAELYIFEKYCNNLMLKLLDLFAIGLKVWPTPLSPHSSESSLNANV